MPPTHPPPYAFRCLAALASLLLLPALTGCPRGNFRIIGDTGNIGPVGCLQTDRTIIDFGTWTPVESPDPQTIQIVLECGEGAYEGFELDDPDNAFDVSTIASTPSHRDLEVQFVKTDIGSWEGQLFLHELELDRSVAIQLFGEIVADEGT